MSSRANQRYPAPRVTLFNHKGGVGKTIVTFNVAAALAAAGHKVLLVDSDPQCNLTSLMIESSVLDDLLDNSDEKDGQTLWSALKPIAEGTGPVRIVEPVGISDDLYILPGDIRLAGFESELESLWSDCFARKVRGFRGTTALSSLVNEIAWNLDADVIFYDCGPNIGALNRVVMLDCDGFAIPAAYDLFSVRAVKTLGQSLVKWIEDWQTIVELAPDGLYLLPGQPALLGYIPQRFKVYGKQPSRQYAKFLPLLERHVQSDVVKVLQRLGPGYVIPASLKELKLGEVKDFGSLANESQRLGVWMPDVREATHEQRADAKAVFSQLAEELLSRAELATSTDRHGRSH